MPKDSELAVAGDDGKVSFWNRSHGEMHLDGNMEHFSQHARAPSLATDLRDPRTGKAAAQLFTTRVTVSRLAVTSDSDLPRAGTRSLTAQASGEIRDPAIFGHDDHCLF